eukprot:1390467-Pleurochrysis_carterae.AAC.1
MRRVASVVYPPFVSSVYEIRQIRIRTSPTPHRVPSHLHPCFVRSVPTISSGVRTGVVGDVAQIRHRRKEPLLFRVEAAAHALHTKRTNAPHGVDA